ncbi:fructose PTS transporter subunit IIA [Enterococcus hulanensis]|uniref:Fructose PTS transporter subunit IIA n=1 Tax=Enterococcus hulanensis TaxID=2559929 RepID=A0ABU3EUK5_9ENTE|nr:MULTISPECIES: fructose PTS transporter subunit IIA [Enterococcus]MBX8935509.1 PTS transporter subunit EIIA [Enterococcus gilvus]MDT2598538.1 fructose PTS transporter subunit IIA [Enterococcus hulanensis]MDT2607957.1 fructose PTS transporter subunit IIA [Enterococcus hulanensis]MDT2615252.1 fructose PTS transporter subunit IIA [Enterococcus hulanensis]MDT2626777.1 fructose PTS transporter subunit IIA [Enterococcus hulanensis]
MEKIELNKVIHEELLKVRSVATTKTEVINELGELLQEKGFINSASEFIKDVYLREEEGETGIGQGVAIPHGKSTAVLETTVAIAVLEQEIEWETLDGEGVKVVIMFAVKDSDVNTTHVLLLQQVAILLANNTFIEAVKNVESADALYKLITEFQ